jgi:hypothetical protein
MRNEWLGSLCVALCLLGSNAAYAGTKHIHNMDVKAQCIAKGRRSELERA